MVNDISLLPSTFTTGTPFFLDNVNEVLFSNVDLSQWTNTPSVTDVPKFTAVNSKMRFSSTTQFKTFVNDVADLELDGFMLLNDNSKYNIKTYESIKYRFDGIDIYYPVGTSNTWSLINRDRVRQGVSGTNITLTFDHSLTNLAFTGSSGNVTIPPDTFIPGVPRQQMLIEGEIEGGSKTFVAGTGVTLRYPDGQGLVAPTGSRFIVRFKSANDALVTIIKPYTSTVPNASTTERGIIEQATDAETITGTDTERAVSPANLQAKLNALILSATATLDFPTIAAGETERLTATVTGAALLDPVLVSGPADIYNSNNSTIDAWVSSANTVTVRVRNNGAGPIDPDEGQFKIKVFK